MASAAWKAKKIGKLGVPIGLYTGLMSGWLYIRYSTIALPD
jgi:N-acetylglucosamine PTS system EIICBA or EIICB component